MSTEQSQPADSVEAGISALQDKLFGAVEPEAADEPQEPVEAGEQAEDVPEQPEPEDQESEADSDYVEVEVDGEPYRVPPKLKDAVMASKDYTEKTQAIAERTRALEDKAQFVEVREAMSQALQSDMKELLRLEVELSRYESVDWSNIPMDHRDSIRDQRDALRQQVASQRQVVEAKTHQGAKLIEHYQKRQAEMARNAFLKSVGNFTDADKNAMQEQVYNLGFTAEEVSSKVNTDERFLRLVWKAAKFDALQNSKGAALQKVKNAPPVVRPGSVPQYKTEQGERMNFRKAIKAARSDSQKADLIGNRLANKFRF